MRVSFDHVNFALRPNKHIERRLVFDALRALDPAFALPHYPYVGFGSLWFADFVLAHRVLGISDMISIQKGEKESRRCQFNAPYSGIRVLEGEAAKVLPGIELDGRPHVLWLDYESAASDILPETGEAARRLHSGSILLITVNASREALDAETIDERYKLEAERFRSEFGAAAPLELPSDFFEAKQYSKWVAAALIVHLRRQVRVSGRDVEFEPLFNFCYNDRAPMVTVGGMVANAADRSRLDGVQLHKRFEFVGEQQVEIAAPPLTVREKLALDRLLPSREPLTEAVVSMLGFSLKPSQILHYEKFYSIYPVFGEWIA